MGGTNAHLGRGDRLRLSYSQLDRVGNRETRMTRDRKSHWLTMDSIAADGIRWKISTLDPSDPRRSDLVRALDIFDANPDSGDTYPAIESLTGASPDVPHKRFIGNSLLGRGYAQSQDTHLPRKPWARPDVVFEGVEINFRGCRNTHQRLVRMAETVRVPINVTASARYLVSQGMSSQDGFKFRNIVGHLLATSDDFERVRNGYYELKTPIPADLSSLLTVGNSENGENPLK